MSKPVAGASDVAATWDLRGVANKRLPIFERTGECWVGRQSSTVFPLIKCVLH